MKERIKEKGKMEDRVFNDMCQSFLKELLFFQRVGRKLTGLQGCWERRAKWHPEKTGYNPHGIFAPKFLSSNFRTQAPSRKASIVIET